MGWIILICWTRVINKTSIYFTKVPRLTFYQSNSIVVQIIDILTRSMAHYTWLHFDVCQYSRYTHRHTLTHTQADICVCINLCAGKISKALHLTSHLRILQRASLTPGACGCLRISACVCHNQQKELHFSCESSNKRISSAPQTPKLLLLRAWRLHTPTDVCHRMVMLHP